ncbi:hypothetical protein PIB30_082850 [Stylosanthes scabra]|uniref:Uncharacterized protein n=1 Tax=Stylosanthes scabra TaxID=79078 RepID=A0ABU6RS90_9FABA|nr:hypothetical protein [Stylosanthes scabra]
MSGLERLGVRARKCTNYKTIDDVRVDLLRKGFMPNYRTWVQHGEGNLDDLTRRSSLDKLVVSTSTGTAVTVGIRYARARPRSAGSLRITIGGLCPSSAWHRITRSGFGGTAFFRLQRGYEHRIYESWRMRASKRLREIMHGIRNKGAPHGWIREDLWEDFKKLKQVNKRNRASSTGGSLHTGGSTTYEATRERMAVELGRTPMQSEVFARTHTRKEDREWVDKRSSDVNDAYEAELKRLQDERQAAIDAGDPAPPQSTRPRCGHE